MNKILVGPVVLQLVRSFDNDLGLPAQAYFATAELVEEVYGAAAADVFTRAIDSVDDRFWLRSGIDPEAVVCQITGWGA